MVYIVRKKSLEYISHHGIKGQKWGVRNGPPYPLSEGDHSAAEKKASSSSGSKGTKKVSTGESGSALLAAYLAMWGLMGVWTGTVMGARAMQAAVAKKKNEKVNKRIEANTNVDKKTGLKLKDREYTEKEDMAQVNPGYKNFSQDTKNNCQNCTITYEMRRRGYDVTANKREQGFHNDELKNYFPGVKTKTIVSGITIDAKTHEAIMDQVAQKRRIKSISNANFDGAKEAISNMKKEPNSRGNLTVQWGVGGGHSMFYEVNDGVVTVRDCQSNKVLNERQAEKMLASTWLMEITRYDNLKINPKRMKEVCH